MIGDLQDDWVTTSPLKVAHPPSKRAFTPGRVLSRDEIRQQRRRGHGNAVSAVPPAAVLPTGLFEPPSVNNAGKQDNNDAKDREDRENKQTVNKVQSTYSTTNENSGNSLNADTRTTVTQEESDPLTSSRHHRHHQYEGVESKDAAVARQTPTIRSDMQMIDQLGTKSINDDSSYSGKKVGEDEQFDDGDGDGDGDDDHVNSDKYEQSKASSSTAGKSILMTTSAGASQFHLLQQGERDSKSAAERSETVASGSESGKEHLPSLPSGRPAAVAITSSRNSANRHGKEQNERDTKVPLSRHSTNKDSRISTSYDTSKSITGRSHNVRDTSRSPFRLDATASARAPAAHAQVHKNNKRPPENTTSRDKERLIVSPSSSSSKWPSTINSKTPKHQQRQEDSKIFGVKEALASPQARTELRPSNIGSHALQARETEGAINRYARQRISVESSSKQKHDQQSKSTGLTISLENPELSSSRTNESRDETVVSEARAETAEPTGTLKVKSGTSSKRRKKNLEEELFENDESEPDSLFDEPAYENRENDDEPKEIESEQRIAKRQELCRLQDFEDWTWPAVKSCLQTFRSTVSAAELPKVRQVEKQLEGYFKDILVQLRKLEQLQIKRRKEADRAERVQAERVSVAKSMRIEQRRWKASRRKLRLNVGLHEAAVVSAARAILHET